MDTDNKNNGELVHPHLEVFWSLSHMTESQDISASKVIKVPQFSGNVEINHGTVPLNQLK